MYIDRPIGQAVAIKRPSLDVQGRVLAAIWPGSAALELVDTAFQQHPGTDNRNCQQAQCSCMRSRSHPIGHALLVLRVSLSDVHRIDGMPASTAPAPGHICAHFFISNT